MRPRAFARVPVLWIALACLTAATARAHDGAPLEIRALDRRIAAGPVAALDLLRRGELHRIEQEWAEAEADYGRAETLAPGLPELALCRAALALDRGRPAETLPQLEALLAREPGHAAAHVLRARALLALGRPAGAVTDLSAALETLERPTPELYLLRADARLQADPAAREAALAGLDEGIRRLGPAVALVQRAIGIEIELGRHDRALARLEAIAPQYQRREAVLEQRGRILAAAGRAEEARAAYAAALAELESLEGARRRTPATIDRERRLRDALGATR